MAWIQIKKVAGKEEEMDDPEDAWCSLRMCFALFFVMPLGYIACELLDTFMYEGFVDEYFLGRYYHLKWEEWLVLAAGKWLIEYVLVPLKDGIRHWLRPNHF